MKKFYRRSISGLLALLICFTTILGSSVTALATSVPTETAKCPLPGKIDTKKHTKVE